MSLLGGDDFFDELPVDQHSCKLLGPTALIVQGLMGLLVITSLVVKRQREQPKRPWRIWSFDVTKQVIGQMFVHGVNVLISGIVASLFSGNACVLYFLNILIDTTLGVAIIYLTLHSINFFLTEKCGFKGYETGKYGNPPSLSYWFRQLSVYLFSLATMKLLVVGLFALWPGVFKLGEWLLTFLGPSEAAQVIFTMGIFPIIMNILQFWLIDSIVKASAHQASVALPSDSQRNSLDEGEEEPLFRASEDDEDRDPRPHDIENPPIAPRSRSVSKDRPTSRSPDEPKSSVASSTTASGSITPKAVDVAPKTVAMHAYPPSVASSWTSSSTHARSSRSPSSRGSSASPQPRASRRSPSPSLSRHPRPLQPFALSPPDKLSAGGRQPAETNDHDEKEWAAWDDEGNDWGDRGEDVGWTGQRPETNKSAVHNVWADHGRENSVRVSVR
ncbi:STIMATE domain-containing protein [Phanerochaete sordida]|uniref:STIMATE domain-containing protein n=1 Tax=Phanerochaete sordida TaxID=48140 RepID=A0A9P3L8C2_9APHY|nr:STIMATE domain-containing protein [Phanerochaete sordida]